MRLFLPTELSSRDLSNKLLVELCNQNSAHKYIIKIKIGNVPVIGGTKKFNAHNYNNSRACIE